MGCLGNTHFGAAVTTGGGIILSVKPGHGERMQFPNKHLCEYKFFGNSLVNVGASFFEVKYLLYAFVVALPFTHTLERVKHSGAVTFNARRHNI